MKYKWERHTLFLASLPFPMLPQIMRFQKKDCPLSCVLRWGQCRTESPPNEDGMQQGQEINLHCFCHWEFWSCLLLQQTLAYPNLPKIKNYSDPGFKLSCCDTKAGSFCSATLQVASLLFRNKTLSGYAVHRKKLTLLLLLSYTWNKINFFFLQTQKEHSLSKGQWKGTKELARGEQKIRPVERIH